MAAAPFGTAAIENQLTYVSRLFLGFLPLLRLLGFRGGLLRLLGFLLHWHVNDSSRV